MVRVAKLPKNVAKSAADAESQDYSALDPGRYAAKLVEVQTTKNGQPLEGPSGPYWTWVFEVVGPKRKGRKLYLNTSHADSAAWKLKQVFEGLGYTTDSDTDEMLGEKCTLTVSTQPQAEGRNAGRLQNNIDFVGEYDPDLDDSDDEAVASAGAGVQF